MKKSSAMIFLSAVSAFASTAQAASYEVTLSNNLADELLAPILVAPVENDQQIFSGHYVSKEAESQILTGDPAMLAKKIGVKVTVAHGTDGPPGVLLAPGKTLTFTVNSDTPVVRFIAMVAPTKKSDHFVSAIVNLTAPDTVTLDRYDIGHDEGNKSVSHVASGAATIKIKKHM